MAPYGPSRSGMATDPDSTVKHEEVARRLTEWEKKAREWHRDLVHANSAQRWEQVRGRMLAETSGSGPPVHIEPEVGALRTALKAAVLDRSQVRTALQRLGKRAGDGAALERARATQEAGR
jgi:hypothetical protein